MTLWEQAAGINARIDQVVEMSGGYAELARKSGIPYVKLYNALLNQRKSPKSILRLGLAAEIAHAAGVGKGPMKRESGWFNTGPVTVEISKHPDLAIRVDSKVVDGRRVVQLHIGDED
jgi:hypothetical protein